MDYYVDLAKQAIEAYITQKKITTVPENLPRDFYSRRAGVFVTIYNSQDLRGCIGTFLPTRKNIAEEVIYNAISAATEDYRFDSILSKELPQLNYEVSILSEPIPIQDIRKHNPQKHGIIARCPDGRSGLLLPGLQGINETKEQISIACQKGGIDPKEGDLALFEFTIEKHP